MEYRQLGRSELKPSVIAVGALHFGNLCDERAATQIIDGAERCGINFIDTAPMYGNGHSESFVGKALKNRRDRFLLSSKVGLEPLINASGQFGVQKTRLTASNIKNSVEKSLTALGTDYLDLLQLHAFDAEVPVEETLAALESLLREGKIRFYGGSNYDPNELATVIRAVEKQNPENFVSLQSHYNILERKLEESVIPQCGAAQISVMCYRGLARGILSGGYRRGVPPSPQLRGASSPRISRHLTEEMYTLLETLEDFAGRYGKNCSELALAWLLAQPQVGVIILGMRNPEQVSANISAVEWKLSTAEWQELDSMIATQGLFGRVKSEPQVYLET